MWLPEHTSRLYHTFHTLYHITSVVHIIQTSLYHTTSAVHIIRTNHTLKNHIVHQHNAGIVDGKKRTQNSTQGRHTLPEGTDLPKLPKRRLYISWIIRRQKGNPKGLDLKAHEAYFNNDRTDESFVSYTRGASQSLCD